MTGQSGGGSLMRVWLLLLVLTAVPVTWSCSRSGSADTKPSPAAEIAGFYEGNLQSQEYGEVPLTLNLRVESGRLAGTLFTPLGDFPVAEEEPSTELLALRFILDDGEVGTIAVNSEGDEIFGTWAMSGDGGAIALLRIGPPQEHASIEPKRVVVDLTTEEWREDLAYLAAELPRRHGSAFHTISREVFEDSIRALDARLPALHEGHEVFAAMGRIVAMIGDGHTYLQLPETFHRYPVRLYAFGDTLRITHADSASAHLLGAQVRGMGEIGIGEVARLVSRQIAGGENEYYVLKELPWFLVHAEILHANGVVSDPGEAQWAIETTSGESATVGLVPLGAGEDVRWISAAQSAPLYRQRAGEDLWYTFLGDSGTLYVVFRGYPARPAFREFFDEMFRFADRNPVERLVIDLRGNSGGDFTKVRDLLLPQLKQHPLNRRGRFFVAIDRHTFSAAMTNAADFLNQTNATLVGEPTGARPNGWQEKGEFTLPNSGLTVSVSTEYYRFLDEDLPAVMPHEHISLTWEDYRRGHDPVLHWIKTSTRD